MTPEQIREIVKLTLDELAKRKEYTPANYTAVLKVVDRKLYSFFGNKGDGSNIGYILKQLSDDPYIDIIFLQYRDKKTIEWIAGWMNKDTSTIKRNKKRLIMRIYELLETLRESLKCLDE